MAARPAAAPFALAERSYGSEPNSERHAHLQVVMPLAGALEMSVGRQVGRVAGSRFAVVAPGTDHVFHSSGANRFLIADFHGDFAARSEANADDPFRLLNRRAATLLPVLRLEASTGALAEPAVADALGRYARAVLRLDDPETAEPEAAALPVIGAGSRTVAGRVRAFLDETWAAPVTLSDAARAACCSPAHATRCFRAAYGIGPIAYLQTVRIDRARRLLETTDLSAGEVAARVGFVSQPWFTRLFAREVGMPPAAYRAAILRESGKWPLASGKP